MTSYTVSPHEQIELLVAVGEANDKPITLSMEKDGYPEGVHVEFTIREWRDFVARTEQVIQVALDQPEQQEENDG